MVQIAEGLNQTMQLMSQTMLLDFNLQYQSISNGNDPSVLPNQNNSFNDALNDNS